MNSCQLFVLKISSLSLAILTFSGCGDNNGAQSYLNGESAFAIRDFARASREFTKTTLASPSNVDAWMMLARTNLSLGDLPAAKIAVEEAEKFATNDVDVIELSGQIAYHLKDYKKATELFQKLANEKNDRKIRARGLNGLAVVEMTGIVGSAATENRAKARVNLLECIRLDGTNASARYHLGRLYRDSFDYREAALDQFELFVRLETNEVERVQQVQRRFIPDLKEAIARAATIYPGVNNRDSSASATALKKADESWKKGNFKTAKQQYEEAYKADVLSFPAALGLAKSIEKVDTSKNGQREALKYYKFASQLRPSSRETLMTVGDLAMKAGNLATAVEGYSRALAARPGDISAIDGLIRSLQKSGDNKSAQVYQTYRNNLPKRK